MARKKREGSQLSVFKGREARLNRVILQRLTKESPQTIWDLKNQITKNRSLKRTRYHNVNSRVKALERLAFVRKIGERATKAGSKAFLYEATPRAHFAMLLDSFCPDELIDKLSEETLLAVVSLVAAECI